MKKMPAVRYRGRESPRKGQPGRKNAVSAVPCANAAAGQPPVARWTADADLPDPDPPVRRLRCEHQPLNRMVRVRRGGFLQLYITIAVPILLSGKPSKHNAAISISLDTVTMLALLKYIEWTTGGSWFLTFALPVTLLVGVTIIALDLLALYTDMSRLGISAVAVICTGVFCLAVELLFKLRLRSAALPCLVELPAHHVSAAGRRPLFIDRNKPLKESSFRSFSFKQASLKIRGVSRILAIFGCRTIDLSARRCYNRSVVSNLIRPQSMTSCGRFFVQNQKKRNTALENLILSVNVVLPLFY